MPTYDYKCVEGHEFSAEQSIKDDPITECIVEDCGAEGVAVCGEPCKRQIGTTSFKFKGGAPTPKHYG